MPSLRSHQLDLVVAIDTSGSIKDGEMQEFIDEIDALKGQVRARVTLLPCDAALCDGAPFRFEPWEQFSAPSASSGGGGTSFGRCSTGSTAPASSPTCWSTSPTPTASSQTGAPLPRHLAGERAASGALGAAHPAELTATAPRVSIVIALSRSRAGS
jgi:hypothetical protein